MRKVVLFIVCAIGFAFISCDDSGSNETRAGIIAEDFIKEQVISSDDLEYDVVGVDETSENEYHVVANIKTLNGLGLKVPRKASIRLRYKGEGDWADKYNWYLISIKVLNEATGEEENW